MGERLPGKTARALKRPRGQRMVAAAFAVLLLVGGTAWSKSQDRPCREVTSPSQPRTANDCFGRKDAFLAYASAQLNTVGASLSTKDLLQLRFLSCMAYRTDVADRESFAPWLRREWPWMRDAQLDMAMDVAVYLVRNGYCDESHLGGSGSLQD